MLLWIWEITNKEVPHEPEPSSKLPQAYQIIKEMNDSQHQYGQMFFMSEQSSGFDNRDLPQYPDHPICFHSR